MKAKVIENFDNTKMHFLSYELHRYGDYVVDKDLASEQLGSPVNMDKRSRCYNDYMEVNEKKLCHLPLPNWYQDFIEKSIDNLGVIRSEEAGTKHTEFLKRTLTTLMVEGCSGWDCLMEDISNTQISVWDVYALLTSIEICIHDFETEELGFLELGPAMGLSIYWKPKLINEYQPTDTNLWLYRNLIVEVTGVFHSDEERELLVREAVMKREKRFSRLSKLASLEDRIQKASKRQPLPDEVKMFVWQRDQGKCVTCGSQENLEFDHIIPVSKGGSNTERNLQLLCEGCNRSKSASIG
jgi:hypothetical protein